MTILIADDNATNLKLLRAILEAYGHNVVEAHDGEHALRLLESSSIEAIISDILMPKVDGYRLCYEVRRSEKHKNLPFVVYTATYTSPADEKLCLDLGVDRYVRKPASSHALLAALGEAIAVPHRQPVVTLNTSDILQEYSERLVDKLEERNVDLHRKSEELVAATLQLQNLLAHSPAVIYTIKVDDNKLVPTLVSDNVERLLGIKPADGSYEWWLASIHPEDVDQTLATVHGARSGEGYIMEYRVRHANGSYRWIEDSCRVIRDDVGTPAKFVGVWMDITDRKHAEAELQHTLQQLETRVQERTSALAKSNTELMLAKEAADEANKSKSEFLSRMSHELRTPMNSILGFGQLLELSELDADQRDSVNHILKGGRHLLTLINEVLEISRIEAGALTISLEPVEVADVLQEAISLMRPFAKDHGVTLNLDGLPSVFVMADRHRLSQVLLNLVSNAIKYNVASGSVSMRSGANSDSLAFIEVVDTGKGISEEMLTRMFVPFDRLAAEATGIEGTGLGLTLSKSLTETMGGTLTVESKVGAGSCFRIQLTLADDVKSREVMSTKAVFDPAVWGSIKGRVLVIEDNAMNSRLLTRIFEECPQIELVTTMQGRLGLELAEKHPPSAILLDLHLPDMQGQDVLAELRANPILRDVPVIILTADAFTDRSQSLLEAGAFRYLTKPFILNELVAAIADALLREVE